MATLDIKDMEVVYEHPQTLTDISTHYCPGCTHGIAHRLVAEVIDEMGMNDKTIGVAPVGCSVFAYNYFNFDFVQAPHGRAPAMATGVKRVRPDRLVFTYQGDGDMLAIGTGEIVAAAGRGENISVIFINNANFGMTGGQMAPTTLPGMKNLLLARRARCGVNGLSPARQRAAGFTGRRQLHCAPQPARPQEYPHGQKSHPARV